MQKERKWLILEEPKEVYKKALKWYSNWKKNYILFLKRIIELNPYIGFDINNKNNVWISIKLLEGRYYCNPRYKKWWLIKPPNIALNKNIVKKLPEYKYINLKDWSISTKIIDIDNYLEKIENFLKDYINKHPKAYMYRLTPDIIWFLHNIIYNWYKQWNVIYKTNKSKQWQ